MLQGGGAFEANDAVDRRILADRGIDRIVMLPTADAYERPSEMVDSARVWGQRLGLGVEPLMVLTREAAAAPIGHRIAQCRRARSAGDQRATACRAAPAAPRTMACP